MQWVPLDTNSFNTPQMQRLLCLGGYAAYGQYLALIQYLARSLKSSFTKEEHREIAFSLHLPVEEFSTLTDLCLKCGVLQQYDDSSVGSDWLSDRIKKYIERSRTNSENRQRIVNESSTNRQRVENGSLTNGASTRDLISNSNSSDLDLKEIRQAVDPPGTESIRESLNANVLPKLPENVDSDAFHREFARICHNLGWTCEVEFPVYDVLPGRNGRIDCHVLAGDFEFFVELDNRNPQWKSVAKLIKTGAPGFVITRCNRKLYSLAEAAKIFVLDNSEKPEKPPQPALQWPPLLDRDDVKTAWNRWLDHKKARGERYKSVHSQQAKLKEWAEKPEEFIRAIEFSMGNNWAGIFAPKADPPQKWGERKDHRQETLEFIKGLKQRGL